MLGGYAASEMLPPRNAVEEDGQRIFRKKKSQNGRRTKKSAVKKPYRWDRKRTATII